ncbi:MAG: thermonuclease family protein [Nitrospirae bacterium]|nr:thermonuclease family protein [Nitrospirota bacterium]MDA1302747.1 thermonuclease family protein [Nitrospirota bacterium]
MMKLYRLTLWLGVFWGTIASPVAAVDLHFHNVTFHRCYHAHSCFVSIPNLPNIFGDVILIRIAGIETPEILGQCPKEKELAVKARNFINTVLENAREIELYELERGENFNLIARIMANGENVSKLLLDKKFALPASEKTEKPDWCKG